jgi:hypothetical protein
MTYTLIAHAEVGSGGAANITFSSIPATFTDLVVFYSLRETEAGAWLNTFLTFNGSSAGYSERMLRGTGTGVGSFSHSQSSLQWVYDAGSLATANTFGNAALYIPNYTSSNAKSVSMDIVTENNSSDAVAVINAGLWNNSAAINSISITSTPHDFVQYSSATLYGITAGSSGGVVVS